MPVAMIMTCHDSQKQLVATGVMILIDSRCMNRQKYEKASNKLDRQSETLASAMQFKLWTCGLPNVHRSCTPTDVLKAHFPHPKTGIQRLFMSPCSLLRILQASGVLTSGGGLNTPI